MDAYRFECGKDGLTRQILRQGLDVLIVGRDGNAYRVEDWCRSNILFQGEQENLLVADNQTNSIRPATPTSGCIWSGLPGGIPVMIRRT